MAGPPARPGLPGRVNRLHQRGGPRRLVRQPPVYTALAVTAEGHRGILGQWAGGEGAKHWLRVLIELKNRGVEDVLMLVCAGLKSLPDAVGEVWPKSVVQTCVVHLLRASFRCAGRQDCDKIAKALKPVCTAPTEDATPSRFLEFCEEPGQKDPAIVRMWENARAEFVPFLQFDAEIRPIACTTNPIESITTPGSAGPSARGHFPSENAALKCVYLAVMSLDPTDAGRKRWTTPESEPSKPSTSPSTDASPTTEPEHTNQPQSHRLLDRPDT